MKKLGQCSWTEADGVVRLFLVKAKTLMQSYKAGHGQGLHWVSQDISDDAGIDVLCDYSEKLNVPLASLHMPKNTPIHVHNPHVYD